MEMTVAGTYKFFKRKMPELQIMELFTIHSLSTNTARLFFREPDDSAWPSRICVELSASQCELLSKELADIALSIRKRR